MKFSTKNLAIGMLFCLPFAISWVGVNKTETPKTDDIAKNYSPPGGGIFIPFSAVDVEANTYIPYNKVYTRYEAIELRNNLVKMVEANPQSLGLNWALVRFYSSAPNFVGGNKSMALRYAANIYSLNQYAGCLAYEHVYNRSYEYAKAEVWYKQSLICMLPDGMEWKTVKYLNSAPFGVGVSGSFSNGRVHPLYENVYGSYTRKIMVPKASNDYKIITAFMKQATQQRAEFAVTSY